MSDIFYVNYSCMVIPNYALGDCEKLEAYLSVFDTTTYTVKRIAMYHEDDTLYIPRGMDVNYVAKLTGRKPIIEYKSDRAEKTSIRLTQPPRDELQKKSISFLLGLGKFSHTGKKSQLALTLTTGAGKTYCTIAAIAANKKKAMIITHSENIKRQWFESLASYTDLHPSEVCNIDGSKIIKKLMAMTKIPFKVFIVNRQSINSYGKKQGWGEVRKFFQHLGISMKVYDEAHIEFSTILKIDFFSNVEKTIYLTANFERSDMNENRVFKTAFRNVEQYGEESKEIMKKNIIYVQVFFNSNPSYADKMSLKSRHGLDRNKYAEYLMANDAYLDTVRRLLPTIQNLFDDNKVLFLSTTISATEGLKKFIEDEFDEVAVATYNSTKSDQDKQLALESEFISSTPKSLGTGSDIAGLRVVVNSEPFRSAVTANQVPGRLRYWNDGKYSFYFEIIDRGFQQVTTMHRARRKILEKKCAKVIEMDMERVEDV